MSAAEPSAGSTDNATESPTADSNETHTDPAATNGQRPASATDQEDGHSNGNSHHTAQQNGDLIIHLVKIFNDGTEAAYSSTVVDRSIYSQTLRDLRANLSKQQVLDSQANRRRFCTKSRSEVNDSLLFKTYMRMIEGGKATTSKQPSEGGDAGVGPAPSHEATIYITALTTRKARTGFDMNSIPKPDLKLSTDKAVLHEATLKHLDSQYEASLWEAKATATQNVHPYEMSEEEWALVVANNGLTCGYNLKTHDIEKTLGDTTVTTGKQVVGLEHSLHPAFTIKSRGLEEYELFHKVGVEAPTRLARIPRIRVTDDSRVDVVETSSAFETALVKAGFSEHSYEASIGGGAFGISAGVSGGEAENHEDHDLNAGSKEQYHLHVIYKFPRVGLLLDEGCLELSQECKRDWLMVKGDPKKEQEFFDKYGRYFTTRVELGGKLTTTKEVGKKEDLKKTETKDGMKWAAGLSINGQYAGASFRTSHESQSAESNTQDTKGLDVAINWEAHGGDTLLANSPPAWCPTVGSFHNWRIIQQEKVVPLEDLLSLIIKNSPVNAASPATANSGATTSGAITSDATTSGATNPDAATPDPATPDPANPGAATPGPATPDPATSDGQTLLSVTHGNPCDFLLRTAKVYPNGRYFVFAAAGLLSKDGLSKLRQGTPQIGKLDRYKSEVLLGIWTTPPWTAGFIMVPCPGEDRRLRYNTPYQITTRDMYLGVTEMEGHKYLQFKRFGPHENRCDIRYAMWAFQSPEDSVEHEEIRHASTVRLVYQPSGMYQNHPGVGDSRVRLALTTDQGINALQALEGHKDEVADVRFILSDDQGKKRDELFLELCYAHP